MTTTANKATLTLPPLRRYAPYQPGPFRLSMALHPLDLANWIELDEQLLPELAEKRRLLSENHAAVFATLPNAAAGAAETLALLIEHLTTYFPHIYQRQGDILHNRATGETRNLATSSLHPLEIAGRLVPEDLCLMSHDARAGCYRLAAACLCFPSHWRLAEKLGQPLAAIHSPVPNYNQQLAPAMDRLFERLKVEKPVWRINWSVVDDPALFQPDPSPAGGQRADITPENAGEKLWLRTERQTLRRLPQSRDILFTIRVYVEPLTALASRPQQAKNLAAALHGLDKPMQKYKGLQPTIQAAISWLEIIAATSQ